MLALARNGFMTVEQIQRKWWENKYFPCIHRLRKLVKESDYIDVTYIDRNGKGIYFLKKAGLEFVNDYCDENYKLYYKSNKIQHFISCSEFYINFPYKILIYYIEYNLETLIPDIYIRYYNYDKKKEIDMFVEIDRTNSMKNIKHIVKKYEKYFKSMKWKNEFDRFPKCLIVTNNNKVRSSVNSSIPFIFISFDELKGGKLKCLI